MKLTDLSPVWLNENMFAFKCPHCQKFWLTCKNVPMREGKQFELFEAHFGEDWNLVVVPCKPDYSWTISSKDFNTMTVDPSIDASRSGCWHGFIKQGMTT